MAEIVIVDERDEVVGSASKEIALRDGLVHRIARIVITNSANEILMQKRGELVDSPGKWDHSVAGHVDAGEDYFQAALREAREEMGFESLRLEPLTKLYREKTKNDKLVRRFHMVFVASTEEVPQPAADEVAEIRWLSPAALNDWIAQRPEDFTTTTVETQPALVEYFAKLV